MKQSAVAVPLAVPAFALLALTAGCDQLADLADRLADAVVPAEPQAAPPSEPQVEEPKPELPERPDTSTAHSETDVITFRSILENSQMTRKERIRAFENLDPAALQKPIARSNVSAAPQSEGGPTGSAERRTSRLGDRNGTPTGSRSDVFDRVVRGLQTRACVFRRTAHFVRRARRRPRCRRARGVLEVESTTQRTDHQDRGRSGRGLQCRGGRASLGRRRARAAQLVRICKLGSQSTVTRPTVQSNASKGLWLSSLRGTFVFLWLGVFARACSFFAAAFSSWRPAEIRTPTPTASPSPSSFRPAGLR